jgi:beta-lactam-binding protein with PASTA domain/serine/threonine protein kinase
LIGRVLDGRYRIDAKIARGGMATVYRAHDLRLERVCAVKVMHSDLGDDQDFASRFVREAHSAARLTHPNVVSVSDQGDDDGVLFLVMEYVPGRTMRDLIAAEAPMSPEQALRLVEPVLLALAEAHRCGLIHRDVKPENVLIGDDGCVKVADFGLARAFDANTTHTATNGVLIGTVSYLAPELILNGRPDPRSDVYAAGVLLYELLTGQKPHQGEGAIQIAYKHVNEDVPAPSFTLGRPLPAYVDALVLRATARDPERRQVDAKVFLQQLRRVQAALDAGDMSDPELTQDLLPTAPVTLPPSIDYTEETPRRDEDREATTVFSPLQQQPVAVRQATGGVATPVRTAPPPQRYVPPPPRPAPVPSNGAGRPGHPAPARRRRRRPSRGLVLLIVVLLLTALMAYAGWWFGVGRYTSTPGLINLPYRAASAKADRQGLHLQVAQRQYSETVTAGSVISTDPSAGARVVEGGTIDAVVSRGPERYKVPALHEKPLTEVASRLEAAHLAVGTVTRAWSEQVQKGLVLSTTPHAGVELRKDSAVNVVVSRGPQPIKIPDFTGRNGDHADQKLTDLGFQVNVSEENSDSISKGKVISQNPAGGKGFREDKLDLVVSKGPVKVTVPELRADSVSSATNELTSAGLQIKVVRTPLYIGVDRVVRQSPGSGDSVPKGSVVTVYVV